MKYNDLSVTKYPDKKRKGRGISAGQGKTAGRGTKGQNSRSGGGVRPGFEGGQNPLSQRMPKLRGFTSHRPKALAIQIDQLKTVGTQITNETLADKGIIPHPYQRVKLIAGGSLDKKVVVKLQGASASVKAQIEKLGGTFEAVPVPQRQAKDKKTVQTT